MTRIGFSSARRRRRRLRVAWLAALVGVGVLAALVGPAGAAVARPAAVTGLSVQAGDAAGELHVSWDHHPNGARDYRVKWAPVGQNFKKIKETDWNAFPTDNELTISGLWPGQAYKVQVRARFSGPNSQWSEVVTGTAAEAAPEPTLEPDKEPDKEPTPEPDKETSPITTRDHVPDRTFAYNEMHNSSPNCPVNSACTRNKTYDVALTGGTTYVAEVWGSSNPQGGDATKLAITAVEAPNGTKLGSDYSGLQITLREPKVIFTASTTPGTHKIKVRIDIGSNQSPATFRVVVYEHVEWSDCAANKNTDCTVTVGTPQSGELDVDSLSRSDVDWFRVDLTGGQLYEIILRGDSTTHLAVRDPFLRGVYDDRGRLLNYDGSVNDFPYFGATQGTADNDSGPGASALSYFDADYGGTYYIGVTSAGGSRRAGHYVLEVHTYGRGVLANDDCHPGMTAAAFSAYADAEFRRFYGNRLYGQADNNAALADLYQVASERLDGVNTTCEIQLGQTVTGRINHNGLNAAVPGDRDWFKIDLTAGTRYRIEVETRAYGMHNPGLGGIFDSSGTKVHNGNGSRGSSAYSERIHFEPTANGTYYIEVSAGSRTRTNTGRYWLTITEP